MRKFIDNFGPYAYVTANVVRKFPNGRSLRFVLYGAYSALGLIGSECNGIAILDEDHKLVVCDEIAKENTGYFGPSKNQNEWFWNLTGFCTWDDVCELVRQHPRTRAPLEEVVA